MNKFSLLLLLGSFALFGQNSDKACEKLSKINTLIQREHLNPKPVDDSLSVFVFDSFIDQLDPSRNIFLKTEYDSLAKKYRFNIDDAILNKDCAFVTDISAIYKKDLSRNLLLLEKIDQEDIDYDVEDTIRFYKKAFPIYLEAAQAGKVWRKKIKYQILDDVAQSSKNLDSIKANFNALQCISKNRIVKNEICRINSVLTNDNELVEKLYNDFCNYFDPHTSYFSDDTKSGFVASLSKEHLSLGLNVSLNENNEIIVDGVDPDGPAFSTGKIMKGDQVISISNLDELLVVNCASLEAISSMIMSDANKKIVLSLKRKEGKVFDVLIEKEILKDVENTVHSYVIENDIKVGYIKIPSFYADFENDNSKGCAQDVAREVIKLQKENIKGLVIDLVDNGGGSMEEAIKLAGLFVDQGPISIVVDKSTEQNMIEDSFIGPFYNEPIVILVNGNSASASEFFASALQNQNRALLLGGTTLGKSTMQTILPLEENDNKNFVKVTVNKFYNISGKSQQGIGLTPNIIVPEVYETLFQKERELPNALLNDSLTTLGPLKVDAPNRIAKKALKISKKRVAKDSYFNSIKKFNERIDEILVKPKSATPLRIDAVFKDQNKVAQLWDDITTFNSKNTEINDSAITRNNVLLGVKALDTMNNQYQLESLKTNRYVKEAVAILKDLNNFK